MSEHESGAGQSGKSSVSKDIAGGKQVTAKTDDSETADKADVGEKQEDAVALLKSDHRKVETLFQQFTQSTGRAARKKIAQQICLELTVHTQVEEEIFYPACREHDVEDDALDEAQVEHDGAKVLITEILCGSPEQPFYVAKVKVLAEEIRRHVAEEEKRDGLFAKAKAAGVDLNELGRKCAERRAELMKQIEQNGVERLRPRSFTQPLMESSMPRGDYRDRDDRGRYMSDDDRDMYRSSRSGSPYDDDDEDRGSMRRRGSDRDGYGRYSREDDNRGYGARSRHHDRDEDDRYGDDRTSRSRARHDDDDDRRYSSGRGQDRDRDERGRYASDDDDDRRYSFRRGQDRDRDERGRYAGDDDDRRYRSGRRQERERDERGRFVSDDDNDDRGSYRARSRSRDDEDDDRDHDGRGWYGDPEGHAEASRRGWQDRQNGSRSRNGSASSSARNGDRRTSEARGERSRSGSRSSGGSGRGGWFGDPEGHAEAARRGWENR
jgi:hypothetical protein